MNIGVKQHDSTLDRQGEIRSKIENTGEVESPIDNPTLPTKGIRNQDFGFLPIPNSRRYDPNLKSHEQFIFTWKINLVLAGAAVSLPLRQC
jgi:hypothetical protein